MKLELWWTETNGGVTSTHPVQVELSSGQYFRLNGGTLVAVGDPYFIGSVVWTDADATPQTTIGYGTWSAYGSVATGSGTVYAWRRTA